MARIVVVALFALAVAPNLVNKLSVGGRQQAANAAVELSPLAVLSQYAIAGVLILACGAMVVRSASGMADRRGLSPLFLGLLLWAYLLGGTLAHEQRVPALTLVFPLLLVAFWSGRPSVDTLKMVGVSSAAVASVSIFLGLAVPDVGLYTNDAGELALSDKGLIAGNLLSGPFTSTNNLGQCVVLGIPFLLLLRRRWLRNMALALSVVCIVWTGSRSSLFAVALMTVLFVAMRRRVRNGWVTMCLIVLGAGALVVPFVARADPASFSGRGNLWLVSIRSWTSDGLLFGMGDKWYSELAGRRTGLGERAEFIAFHAHNQFLHLLVVGGVIGFVLFMTWCAMSLGGLRLLSDRYRLPAMLWLSVFLASGALELNLDPFDRVQFFGPALVPLLVLGAHLWNEEEASREMVTCA